MAPWEENQTPPPCREVEGWVTVPYGRIAPDTLQRLIEEFITRDWSDFGDDRFSLETKVTQVRQQLREGQAEIRVDLTRQTVSIVPTKNPLS